MSNFANFEAEAARLCILRKLHEEIDGTSNETLLQHVLEAFGHRASREWVRTQLRKLDEIGAVRISMLGGEYMIATLTRAGADHVERRSVIEGVKRPSHGD